MIAMAIIMMMMLRIMLIMIIMTAETMTIKSMMIKDDINNGDNNFDQIMSPTLKNCLLSHASQKTSPKQQVKRFYLIQTKYYSNEISLFQMLPSP